MTLVTPQQYHSQKTAATRFPGVAGYINMPAICNAYLTGHSPSPDVTANRKSQYIYYSEEGITITLRLICIHATCSNSTLLFPITFLPTNISIFCRPSRPPANPKTILTCVFHRTTRLCTLRLNVAEGSST